MKFSFFELNQNMKAVLFAAGEGLRLRPLTDKIPKPLLNVLGKSILERLIENLSKCGINDFIIITNYKEEKIKQHISERFSDKEISYIHQEEIKGTANALFLAEELIDEDFFIASNGDCLFSFPLVEKTVKAAKNEIISIGGKLTKNTENYGIVITNEKGSIESIIEKPLKEDVPEGYANIGIYSLNRDIFSSIVEMEKNNLTSPRGEYEITYAINQLLRTKKYPSMLVKADETDYWFDIGRPWDLLEAKKEILEDYSDSREGKIQENVHIEGKVIIKKNSVIKSGTYIEGPAFIDEGAIIGPNCYIRKYTYIGKEARIGNGCEVKNSIIGDEVHAAHLSYIGDTIISPKCNLGAGTITANLRLDKKTIPVVVKGKKEDSNRRKLGAIIGEEVETGIGALIMPGIKIGSNSWIGAGAIVKEDVPSETIYYVTQTYTLKRKRKNAD